MRTAFDLTPLYRSVIGADRMANLIESAMRSDGDFNYPPYDIEKTGDDSYRISIAAAGFAPDDLELIAQPNLLVVTGRKAESEGQRAYLHHGIATRSFDRRFELADYVVVRNATYADGLLTIELQREVPEPLRPRRVSITTHTDQPRVQQIADKPERARAA